MLFYRLARQEGLASAADPALMAGSRLRLCWSEHLVDPTQASKRSLHVGATDYLRGLFLRCDFARLFSCFFFLRSRRGRLNEDIAIEVGLDRRQVALWRQRFLAGGGARLTSAVAQQVVDEALAAPAHCLAVRLRTKRSMRWLGPAIMRRANFGLRSISSNTAALGRCRSSASLAACASTPVGRSKKQHRLAEALPRHNALAGPRLAALERTPRCGRRQAHQRSGIECLE